MIYKFLLLSDEVDNFTREIEIESGATFLQFQQAILKSVGYDDKQITSFFICSPSWEKLQEITLFEMDSSSDTDTYIMENTPLDQFIEDAGQRLLFVFDNLNERSFFIELKQVITGRTLAEPVCVTSKGNAPVQMMDMEVFNEKQVTTLDEDFYGNDEFNMDELDADGFGDVTFDDNGNEIY